MIRALIATAPLYWAGGEGSAWRKIFLAVSADLIWRDENADLIEGDRAAQGIISAFYRDGDAATTGRETRIHLRSAILDLGGVRDTP